MNNGYAPVVVNPPPNVPATYTIFNNRNQILRFSSNTKFRVYYLEAPLSILSDILVNSGVISSLVEFNIFHSGIGFQAISEKTPFEFTFDYSLINGFNIQTLVPKIIDNEIIWNNKAAVYLGNFIDRNYWNHSTYIATISGDQLILIQEWMINTWSTENPNYVLFSGSTSEERKDLFNPIMRSADCYDFAYALFDFMKYSLFICIDYTVVPNLTIAAFISSFPGSIVPIDFETHRDEIITFFQGVIDFFDNININLSILNPFNIYSAKTDLFSIIQLYVNFYQSLNVIYILSYLPDGSLGYWQITNPRILIDYVQIDIPRSYKSLNIDGKLVTDEYSDLITTCIDVTPQTSSNLTILFIIFLIIVILIIMAIIFMTYQRKQKI